MLARGTSFAPQDVTTIYDALRDCPPRQLAEALLGSGQSQRSDDLRSARALAARRMSSLLRILRALGPDCEASARIVLPWVPSHLAMVSSMAWPAALGTRIALPSSLSQGDRMAFLAQVLSAMSFL